MPDRGTSRASGFGAELRLARVRAGMLQSELAEIIGVHPTSISQWERGDRNRPPSQEVVDNLDKALDADGALARAAGYTPTTDMPTAGILPLPANLDTEDIALLVSVAKRLSTLHG